MRADSPVDVNQVKGARPAGSSSTTPASRGPSEAAGVPSNFGAGQQVMGNPLAPLMNAQYAGQLGGFVLLSHLPSSSLACG